MQRLTALDASFLDLETDEVGANVAWFSVLEGPAPDHDELMRYIEGKLALVPRYRQKLRFLPLGIARPLWIDDPNFNLDYHIRRTALPAPGGEEELTRLFARVVSQPLDPRRDCEADEQSNRFDPGSSCSGDTLPLVCGCQLGREIAI